MLPFVWFVIFISSIVVLNGNDACLFTVHVFNHILKFFFLYFIMAIITDQMKDEIQEEKSHDFLCVLG